MKTPFYFLALALACSACHPQTNSPAAAGQVEKAPTDASAAVAASGVVGLQTAVAHGLPDKLALLQHVDLSAAWRNEPEPGENPVAMEGFYGPDNYRVSFFFTKVRRDALMPEVYHIEGLNRYKKSITPFAGTCTIKRIATLPDTVAMTNSKALQGHTAFAEYELKEDPTTKGAGVYSGKAVLDFCVDAKNRVRQTRFDGMDLGLENPTKGSGLIFKGLWRNNKTGQIKAASWSSNYAVIVPETLEKMGLGSRGDTIYPELAKYGWNEWYANDEWWAKPTKPALSL